MNLSDNFTSQLLQNLSFQEDLKRLFSLPAPSLSLLLNQLPDLPQQLHRKSFVEKAAAAINMDVTEYHNLATVAKIICSPITENDLNAKELVGEFASYFQIKLKDDQVNALVDFLESAAQKNESASDISAFDYGLTFMRVQTNPLIAPIKKNEKYKYVLGATISIYYSDPNEKLDAFSFNLSHAELNEVIASLQEASAEIRDAAEGLRQGEGK